MEIEREPNLKSMTPRERVMMLCMVASMGVALLSRFTNSPKRWNSVDGSMSPEDLLIRLGTPSVETTNEMRWHEKRWLGDWELIAVRHGTQVTGLRQKYYWPGTDHP
jgi:hypothetical protein